jgi:hypothetical protein
MSFGVSPSDFVMLLKGLMRLAAILRGEALESFKRCARTYQTFAEVAKHLDSFATGHDIQDSELLRHTLHDIEALLREYFGKIKDFQLFLGPRRVRRSFRGAIAKIKWSRHAKTLGDLRQDLETRMNTVIIAIITSGRANVPMKVLPGLSGLGPVPRPLVGDHFTFEDAYRVVHLISFRDISSWEHLHAFLLRIFPCNHRGHSAIETKSYALHNASTGKDFLPSSPSVKPIRDVIALNERIEMSVIFPYEDSYTTRCPRCNTRRRDTSCVVATCHRCGLWVRFQDSFEDEADPLTQLAIDDIRETSLGAFVKDFVAEADRNGYLNANRNECQLKDLISHNFPDLRAHSSRGAFQARSEIRDFLRVTLCLPQWPSFGQNSTYQRAERRLTTVVDGLKRTLRLLQEGSDLPVEIAAKAINSRLNTRAEGAEGVLRSACLQQNRNFMQIVPVLAAYSQCAKESKCQFHPSVVKARCLLWTFSQILTLEGKLLLRCSEALSPWSAPEEATPRETSTFHKLCSVLFIPHVLICRATFDVVADVVSHFSDPSPPPDVLGAIFWILKDSRSLCLEFCVEGTLENCDLDLAPSRLFDGTAFMMSDTALADWRVSCRRCLESVLRSEGRSLQTDSSRQLLWTFWQSRGTGLLALSPQDAIELRMKRSPTRKEEKRARVGERGEAIISRLRYLLKRRN